MLVASYPVLRTWVRPLLLTDPLQDHLIFNVMRFTTFIVSLFARIVWAKLLWMHGLDLFQSLADRRRKRSAASPDRQESINFLRSSLSMELRVLSVLALTCSMSALDSLSGCPVRVLAGVVFGPG
jgi:hypothetical protein